MRALLTALATSLTFFSGTVCESIAFDLETELLTQPAEECESDSRARHLSSERAGLKADAEMKQSRIGKRTVQEWRATRNMIAWKRLQIGFRTGERCRIPEHGETVDEQTAALLVGGKSAATGTYAVIIDDDLKIGLLRSVRTTGAPDRDMGQSVYEISVDIENMGDCGRVMIVLAGMCRDGRERASVLLTGVLNAHESRSLTATASLSSLKSREVESWEVFRAHIFRGRLPVDQSRVGRKADTARQTILS